MEILCKNFVYPALTTLMCVFIAFTANAQRTSGGGGGGGGSHSSSGGGSSVSSARPSGGGGGASFSRPSGVSSNVSRSSPNIGQRGSVAPSRPGYVYRNGAIVRNNYTPRPGVAVRGNYGYPLHTGVPANGYRSGVGANSYRTAPRVGYANSSYWGTHGYYHYNHGYYNTYYGPNLGYSCRYLPYGYYPFFWGDSQYYLCDGLFYTYDNSQYTVVEPPIGAEVTTLPDKAQSIVINGQQYYECDGVYYEAVTKDDGTTVYMVAGKDGVLNTDSSVQDDQPRAPQMGDIVNELPQDCRKIKVNGQKLWVSADGIYYQEQVDGNGSKTYKIVGLPADN